MGEKERPKEGHSSGEGVDDRKKPMDPKRVIQILECKRKILEFVELMLEPDISEEELKLGENIICWTDYDSIVQERFILKLCGYPLCSNRLTREWKQKYHLSLKDKRIYDVEVRKLYCSVRCMDASLNYRNKKINEQPMWMRLDDLEIKPNFEIRTSSP